MTLTLKDFSHIWYFSNSSLPINNDIINDVSATFIDFTQNDVDASGVHFDGTSNYIDLSTNSIDFDSTFAFDILVKSVTSFTNVQYDTNEIYSFKKIRVRRVADQEFPPLSTWINLMHIAEIQVWINGTNVALNGTLESSSTLDSRYVDTNVIDNDITGFVDAIWHNEQYDGDYDFVAVVLSQTYDISNIESVVVYSPTYSQEQQARDDMMKGCVIELLDENNNIIATTPTITSGKRYNRFDGPAISNVSTFSSTPSATAIIEPPLIITSSNQVSVISNMNLWTTRNFISADGKYMVVSTLGSHADNYDGGEVLYYSQDGGVTWQLSTINDSVKTIGGIRNGSITANGQYSCFHDTNMNNGVYVYYSSDYCQTYNYAGKTATTYYGFGPFINETGTIMILGSTGISSPYHDLHIGYVNQSSLSSTTWTILNVSGLDVAFAMGFCGNADFTHILIGTSTGTFVFNNNDTSKLTNASYWSRSSNSNVSNMFIRTGYSSLDNSVIVLVNYVQYSKQIWFSTDYGSSFYNLYNNDLSEFSQYGPNVHVSPNGEYVVLWRAQVVGNIFIYSVGDNGTYTKLLTIPSSTFNGAPVAHVSISDVGKIIVTNHTYGSHNLAAAWVLDIDMGNFQSWNITENVYGAAQSHIFSFGNDDSNKLELTTSDNIKLTLTNSGVVYDVSYNGSITDFTRIIGIINNNTMSLYVNNTLADSTSVTPYADNTTFTHNYLGSDLSNTNLFEGSIVYFKTALDYYFNNILDVSASAVFYISQSDIQNVFKVRTSETNISNINYNDLLHFVHMDQWPSDLILNPFNAKMDQSLSENAILTFGNPSKMLVKHDYIRYLSTKLFNNPHCVSMFNNEVSLVNSIESTGNSIFQNDISNVFWKFSTDSSYSVSGFVYDSITGKKATNNTITSNDNICRELLNTLIQNAFSRFDNVGNIIDASGVFPLPIYQGDTISFKTLLNPTENQHLLTNSNEFGGRSYSIKLVIT